MTSRLESCIAELSPIPAVALEALAALQQETVNAVAIADVLGRDPALAGRVLRLANSPFYGCSGRIATLREAFLVLGSTTTRHLVLAAGAMESLHGNHRMNERQWRHSMRTASLARALAPGRVDPDVASTAGLLHDIGRFVMDACLGNEAEAVSRRAWERGEPIDVAERSVLGFDHADVGGRVAERWRLPGFLNNAIARHHSPDAGGEEMLVDVVHVADAMAHALDRDPKELVPLVSERAWSRLGLHADAVEELLWKTVPAMGR